MIVTQMVIILIDHVTFFFNWVKFILYIYVNIKLLL